jgi:hypothetical protein
MGLQVDRLELFEASRERHRLVEGGELFDLASCAG